VKQVLHSRAGLTVVRDVPRPPCPAAGVLVRTAYSAISPGTDRARLADTQRSLLQRARERPDLVRSTVQSAISEGVRRTRESVEEKLATEDAGGYSSAGRVIEVGPRVSGLRPGDPVACGGVGHAVHAEVVAVPRNLCARIPSNVALPPAALTTIAAIAMHGLRLSGVALGERVAVIGCGLVGQIACRIARSAGAEVIALDLAAARVEEAVAAGADNGVVVSAHAAPEVTELTGGAGVDHAIVAAAADTAEPLLLGAEVLRDRGALTLIGAVPVELPREPLYRKELRFQVSRSYGPGRYDPEYEERGLDYPLGQVRWTEQRNMEAILSLQARGLLRLDDLIDEIVPVERAEEAFARVTGPPAERPRGAIVLEYAEAAEEPQQRPAAPAAPARASDGAPAVGFIGVGDFARSVLVPALAAAGARLAVAGGGSGPSAEAAVRRLGFERAAPSAEAVIEDPGVDAVVIGTRHDTHAELARRALEAGKHVFCEKPLALDEEELDGVIGAARASQGILAVGFNRRFSPLLRELRDFVGRRGGAVNVVYRVAAGSLAPEHWAHDIEQGGGRIIGEVCHFVDCLAYIAGSPCTEVVAAGHGRSETPVQAIDNVAVTITHDDGSVGTIVYVARSEAGVGKERVEAFGAGGIGVLDDYRSLELHGEGAPRPRRLKRQDKGHAEEMQAFVEGVRAGRAPIPLDQIENVSRATLAVVEALRTGLPVRLA
jgi:predicted dehydrogenase/threonine dehydrogenase-like Zn-dependent dehydrogenase